MGSAPSALSIVSTTSARPSGGRPAVPAKMTSSILPPRSVFAPCSPRTQAMASTTLDLPEPLGPTTQVMPGSKRSVVDEAKDLKPRRVRLFRCTGVGSTNSADGRGRPPTNLAEGGAAHRPPRRFAPPPLVRRGGAWKRAPQRGALWSRALGVESGERGLGLLRDGVGNRQRQHVVIHLQPVAQGCVGRLEPGDLVLEVAAAVAQPTHLGEHAYVGAEA